MYFPFFVLLVQLAGYINIVGQCDILQKVQVVRVSSDCYDRGLDSEYSPGAGL